MNKASLATWLGVGIYSCLALPAAAQRPVYSPGEIRVYSASRLIVEPINHSMTPGRLRFNLRPESSRAWPRQGLRARLFRLPAVGNEPVPWDRNGDCWIYHSNVTSRIARGAGEVEAFDLSGLPGLTVTAGGVSNGRFLVVFEEIVPTHAIFRLQGAQARREYFSRGWRVEVRAVGPGTGAAERARYLSGVAAVRAGLQAEVASVAGRTCFNRVRLLADAGTSEERLVQLEICAEPAGEL